VSLRDELNRRLTDFDLDVSEDFIDTLLPWLEQKLSEAQAATAEGCAGLADKMSDPQVIFEKLPSCSEPLLIAGAFQVLAKAIRALSPDPHARERWELEARLEVTAWALALFNDCVEMNPQDFEAKYGRLVDPEVLMAERIAHLEHHLAALPKEGK